ncbi:MAG: Bax inhibitor-1/YccA family protein [Propionibacteriaceae bacterium]|nr:Bax inhibitor-1/YccA family protein [Propionibacteriaceae bacterium]
MANPVLAKSPVFSPEYAQTQAAEEYLRQQQGFPGQPTMPYQPPQLEHTPMTFDDVLTKTTITIGLMIAVAVGTVWVAYALNLSIALISMAGLVCALAAFIFPVIAATRHKIGPGIAIPFAIVEGVFVGSISLATEAAYHGIVIQAVFATFITAGAVLVAFRFGNVRLSPSFLKMVSVGMIAFVVVALANFGLSFLGINLGLFPGPGQPVSAWAWVAAIVGVSLAVFSLFGDFQYIEQGIANRIPASESWRAAYGLTVTMVWLYINLLRILSYLRR